MFTHKCCVKVCGAPPQPAARVASLRVGNLMRAANKDSLWATIAHCIIMSDSRSMTSSDSHTHTHKTHAHSASFSLGNNDCRFGSLQAILCRAACHQTAELQPARGKWWSWTWTWTCKLPFCQISPPCWERHPGPFTRRRPPAGSLLRTAERRSGGGPGGQRSTEIHRFPSRGLCSLDPSRFKREATDNPEPLWHLCRPE